MACRPWTWRTGTGRRWAVLQRRVTASTRRSPRPGDGHLIATNDQALTDVINNLTTLNSGVNPIKTFIIGVGAGVDPTKNPAAAATLLAMSVAGGTNTSSPQGYFPATSPQAVTNALTTIITQILAQTESTASAAVNSTGLNVNSKVYQSQFVTSDTPYQDWTGNLFEYDIDPVTAVINLASPDWSAQTQLDLGAPRIIATWDPLQNRAIPFEWTHRYAAQRNCRVDDTPGYRPADFYPRHQRFGRGAVLARIDCSRSPQWRPIPQSLPHFGRYRG